MAEKHLGYEICLYRERLENREEIVEIRPAIETRNKTYPFLQEEGNDLFQIVLVYPHIAITDGQDIIAGVLDSFHQFPNFVIGPSVPISDYPSDLPAREKTFQLFDDRDRLLIFFGKGKDEFINSVVLVAETHEISEGIVVHPSKGFDNRNRRPAIPCLCLHLSFFPEEDPSIVSGKQGVAERKSEQKENRQA